jgi:predicted acyltransferase
MEIKATNTRLESADVYRGFVMFLMMAEVLEFGKVAEMSNGSSFWSFMAWHQSHVEWVGCSLHDMIQPSFSFLVGVVLPYSIAAQITKNISFQSQFFKAIKRLF